MTKQKKIIIIELDGASWNVMDPLIQQNMLPNLQNLISKGVSGDLLSAPPLISPRLWVSIFSGKYPAKHGIEFFGNSSSMVKCKRIWDIFNDKGCTVGVFGSFVTWPPSPVRGFMIPNLFALGPETYPAEYSFFQELILKERKRGKEGEGRNVKMKSLSYYVSRMKDNGVSLKTLGNAGLHLMVDRLKRNPKDERYWKRATSHLKISTEFFIYLYNKFQPSLSTYHIHLCDALSHRYWKYYEPDKFHDVDPVLVKKYGHVIPDAYIEADRMIGKILKIAGDSIIYVVSDHGSDAMETSRKSYRLHVDNFMNYFKLKEQVIPANIGLMTFCYFHDKNLMEQMRKVFEDIRFAETNEKVFDIRKEETLLGIRLSQSLWGKDIEGEKIIDAGEYGTCKFNDLFLPQKMEVSGTHKKEGILIMAGPGIKQGVRIDGASIFDITPTALALVNYPVAEDMDGKVLEGALQDDFLQSNPVRFIKSYEDSSQQTGTETEEASYDQMKERLQSLGYL